MKQIQRLLVIILGAVSLARAEAPEIITYQGRIRENNLPFTGVKSIEIWMHDCEFGACGTALGTGPQNVSVTNGLFRTTFTVPSGVDLGTANWWLETRMFPGPVIFSPREKLGSSPYALMASTASAIKDGIVTSAKLADGAVTTDKLATDAVDSSKLLSDPASLYKVTGGTMTLAPAGLAIMGQRVGIGTTLPYVSLNVNGGIKVGDTSFSMGGVMRYRDSHLEGYSDEGAGAWSRLDAGWYTHVASTTLLSDANALSLPITQKRYLRFVIYVAGKDVADYTAIRFNFSASNYFFWRQRGDAAGTRGSGGALWLPINDSLADKEYFTIDMVNDGAAGVHMLTGNGVDAGAYHLRVTGGWTTAADITSVQVFGAGGTAKLSAGTSLIVLGHD